MSLPSSPRLRSEALAARNQSHVTKCGRMYICGQPHGLANKLEVLTAYNEASICAQRKGRSPSTNANGIAKACYVEWYFTNKVQNELMLHGRVLPPSELTAARNVPRGAGSKTLDRFDRFVLLQLRQEEPSRTRSSYIDCLYQYTGKMVSKSTISRFFPDAFPSKGHFVKPNLVPYDKFRPENEGRAYKFLYMLSYFSPERVKFGDGKILKG